MLFGGLALISPIACACHHEKHGLHKVNFSSCTVRAYHQTNLLQQYPRDRRFCRQCVWNGSICVPGRWTNCVCDIVPDPLGYSNVTALVYLRHLPYYCLLCFCRIVSTVSIQSSLGPVTSNSRTQGIRRLPL